MIEEAKSEKHSHSRHEIEQLVYIDPLTKLPNRRFLEERLPSIVDRFHGQTLFCFLDLDRFKQVNQISYVQGDALLVAFAKRITTALRANDYLVRVGGDEFVLLLQGLDTDTVTTQGMLICQRLLEQMNEPFVIGQSAYQLTMSIGCCPIMLSRDFRLSTFIESADLALREAKMQGGNAVVMTGVGNNLIHQTRAPLAIPKYVLQKDLSGTVVGVEMLLPAAISNVEQWLDCFVSLIDYRNTLCDSSKQSITLSIDLPNNLVRFNAFRADTVIEKLNHHLMRHRIDHQHVVLELDESLFDERSNHLKQFCQRLAKAGFSLCLDHYGKTDSRLLSQTICSFKQVKIASSLCDLVGQTIWAGSQVKAITSLAHDLGQTPIALCSAEDPLINKELHRLGCLVFQESAISLQSLGV
jgi:diguanylate cyclase (GGDEF)-like protein